MKRVFLLCILLSSIISHPCLCQLDGVKKELQTLSNDPVMRRGQLGFWLADAKTGNVLISQNSEKTFLPASTFKTLVSSAALSLLGEDFRFQTFLETDGVRISDSIIRGNVYLRGTGDPTFGSGRFAGYPRFDSLFMQWADSVYKLGLRKIEGSIVGDGSWFDDANIPESWTWNDIGNYYGAGPSGLNVNENSYTVFFRPSRYPGMPAQFIRTDPEVEGMEFVNQMKTGSFGSGDNGYIYGAPYTFLRYLRGTVPPGSESFSIKGALPEPALFGAQELERALRNRGIEITGKPTSVRLLMIAGKYENPNRTTLLKYYSPALTEIVFWLNKKSLNLYAECLLKALGREKLSEGSFEAGTKVIREWLKVRKIDTDGMAIWDGSGLSRYNQITPEQMGKNLLTVSTEKYFGSFWNSLPVAGDPEDPGTASSIGAGTNIAKNLRAKSGYISGVRGYAGYVKDKSGDLLVFVIIANGFTCGPSEMRKKLEKVMIAMGEIE